MTISAWKTYAVRRSGSVGWPGNHNKNLEDRKNCECYVYRKFKKNMSCFQIEVFFVLFFSVFLLCSLFIIHTFDYHYNNKGAEDTCQQGVKINKTINITSWRNQDKTPYWIFRKLFKSFKLFGVISQSLFPLVTYKITFASFRYLHSHKAQTSLWCCWVIWLSATTGYQKQTDLTCTFSQ